MIDCSDQIEEIRMVTDAYSKQIMGYELCPNLEAISTVKALQRALAKREYPQHPLIHNSDRGLQYCSKLNTESGDPYENAVAGTVWKNVTTGRDEKASTNQVIT